MNYFEKELYNFFFHFHLEGRDRDLSFIYSHPKCKDRDRPKLGDQNSIQVSLLEGRDPSVEP